MRQVKIEHEITEVANLARVIDIETGNLVEGIISLDFNLTAGEGEISGTLIRYAHSPGSIEWRNEVLSDEELPTTTEDVEIIHIDKFDQSQVAKS